MTLDPERFATLVAKAIDVATAPLKARVAQLEKQLEQAISMAGTTGQDGADGAPGPQGEPGAPGTQGPVGPPGPSGEPGPVGDKGEPGDIGPVGPEGPAGRDGRDGLPGVPGSPGLKGDAGQAGRDGIDGKDGVNGRDGTLENLKMAYDGERTLTFCFKNGDPIEGGIVRMPLVIDRGVYDPKKTYEKGDGVTYEGHYWIAQQDTNAQPNAFAKDGSPNPWRLAVMRGRQGKQGPVGLEGKPGPQGPQGIPGRNGY